jgi:DNA polymerase III, gamma/tau subunits
MTLKREVLYQKWRPRKFADVVGQDHITLTLKIH